MKILIDADGCPVVKLTIRIAAEYQIPVTVFCDTAHVFSDLHTEIVTVSKGADAVDFTLVNRVNEGDIVITQDYGLAAMALAKRAVPIHQSGTIYTNENIDTMLSFRHTARKIRNAGGHIKGPKKRVKQDDIAFEQSLRKVLEHQKG
jgi:uncharacterized protein YaiI (UPF0178 family)